MTQQMKLKDGHEIMQKINKLIDLAEELGIGFEFSNNGALVYVRGWEGPPLKMLDIDSPDHNIIMEFPPTLEFKVCFDNPEALQREQEENEKYIAEQKERAKALEERRLAQKVKQAAKNKKTYLENELKATQNLLNTLEEQGF